MSGPSAEVAAISVNHLRKRYGEFTAVDDVSFEVSAGDFFAFLGPNGAGKTTTINTIVGLANYQQGTVRVFGHDVTKDFRQARLAIGLAPQEFNFDRYLTVEEILTYQAGYFGLKPDEARPRARQLLTQFSLWDKRDKDVSKLSGGMKRRLTLARALIHAPRILVLDEPTAGVDLELRLELWDFLKSLNRAGMTIVLTTHYLEEAQQLCNRVGIVDKGKLVALEDTDSLLARLSNDRLELTLERPVAEVPGSLAPFQVSLEEEGRKLVVVNAKASDVGTILRAIEGQGLRLTDLVTAKRNLQDIFLEVTGK